MGVVVSVTWPELPATIVKEEALAASVNVGDGTRTGIASVAVKVPLVALTDRLYVPGATVDVAVRLRVVVAPAVTELARLGVTPVGCPETESPSAELKFPVTEPQEMAAVVVVPGANVMLAGLAASVQVAEVLITSVTEAVWVTPLPVAAKVKA